MATVDLSKFTLSVEETTPIFKTRVESNTEISIYQNMPKEDILEADAHRDPSYQASFNRCTSLGCSDYTKGFNYIPSCGECEQPIFEPFVDRKITCLADILLSRIDYDIDGVLSEDRAEDYGGPMPIVDNDVNTTGTIPTDYYYSDSYVEYKLYNTDLLLGGIQIGVGWKQFEGKNGQVSYNKFYSMSGFWLGFEPCHGANRLYQCAVSCENGEIVGCWQVGDLARESGANPLQTYGEVQFGSVWSFFGLEAGTPSRKYYQIYDPAQIIAAGLKLKKTQVIPLNPTLSINNYQPQQLSEELGYVNCKTLRTSVDFGDADILRETNCLSSDGKRSNSTETRCETCTIDSYKPTRAIDKFLKFADYNLDVLKPDSYYNELRGKKLNEIPKTEFEKLKFTIVGDVRGKIFTDGDNCYFPKSYLDSIPGKFILGGATSGTKKLGFKQATYTDLGLNANFKYDDCILCLESKANAKFETVESAIDAIQLVSPFYDKCGVDLTGSTEHRKYNIDCSCVRCGDVYITGAPRYNQSLDTWGYEPWISMSEAERLINQPEKFKVTAVIRNQPTLIDDPMCVPSDEKDPALNPFYPYAERTDPGCWDYNSGAYRRIWYFWDKSKKFTDFQFRNIPGGTTATYNRNTLWSGCGGLKDGDRAVVPFGITCYEKMNENSSSDGTRRVPSTLSIVTGIKLAPENEFTAGEIASGVLPVDIFNAGPPRTYLYYSRRASTSYFPCDSTNTARTVGTYQCSCEWLPCMDEIMLTAVPIKYGSTPYKTCQDLSPIDSAFPSLYEIHLERSVDASGNIDMTSVRGLYPLVGPNMYTNGVRRNTFVVGLNWDSSSNQNIDFSKISGAEAYKYQSSYFNNWYVDYLEPTYFFNRPISFLNTDNIMKSNSPVTIDNNTYFRLQRLHDAYHINCSKSSSGKYGEFGYFSGTADPINFFKSLKAAGANMPVLMGPVVPVQPPENARDSTNINWGR